MKIKAIEERSELLSAMRLVQGDQLFEVSTPTISTHLIPEATIANFATHYISEFGGSRELYLIPTRGPHETSYKGAKESIYQITKCFGTESKLGVTTTPNSLCWSTTPWEPMRLTQSTSPRS